MAGAVLPDDFDTAPVGDGGVSGQERQAERKSGRDDEPIVEIAVVPTERRGREDVFRRDVLKMQARVAEPPPPAFEGCFDPDDSTLRQKPGLEHDRHGDVEVQPARLISLECCACAFAQLAKSRGCKPHQRVRIRHQSGGSQWAYPTTSSRSAFSASRLALWRASSISPNNFNVPRMRGGRALRREDGSWSLSSARCSAERR